MGTEQPTNRAEYLKRHRAARIAAGLCVRCGLVNDRLPKQTCTACGKDAVDLALKRRLPKSRK